jgi:DNA-binding CsgD family transcriptional regulator
MFQAGFDDGLQMQCADETGGAERRLDGVAEAVYRAALGAEAATAAGIASALSLPLPVVHRALDRLSALALIRPWVESALVRPVSPLSSLGTLISRHQAELMHRQFDFEALRGRLIGLLGEYESSDGSGGLPWQHVELSASWVRFGQLVRDTRDELFWVACSASMTSPGVPQFGEDLRARGVRVRALYPDGVREHPVAHAQAQWLESTGAEVRTMAATPPGLALADGRVAVLPVDAANPQLGAVELQGRAVVAVVAGLMELLWDCAAPLTRRAAPGQWAPTAQEVQLLQLLDQGLTDESVAAKLGISPRSVSRMMSALMDKLHARSRFQAGSRARENGWLD